MEIFIDEKDKLDASVAANSFANKGTRNRVYINTLGAELALKYLASENINISEVRNIHSIKKILEEIDISDIMLPNIHIDVRVVFDENAIFIPKSHFEYNLVPDVYLVFKPAKDLSNAEFLGFFEPKLINKNNANDKYYFIEKEKLSSGMDLKQFIQNFKGNTQHKLSDDDITNCERIMVSMADNDISTDEKRYLIQQLVKSQELRDKFVEFENFETLSYKAMTDSSIIKKELVQNTAAVVEDVVDDVLTEDLTDGIEDINIDDIDNINVDDLTNALSEEEVTEEVEEPIETEETIEDLSEEPLTLPEDIATDEVTDSIEAPTEDLLEIDNNIGEAIADISAATAENLIEDINIDTLSLDNIDMSDIGNIEEEEIIEETVNLDNFAEKEIPQDLEEIEDEKMSLEEVVPQPQEEEKFDKDLENFPTDLDENITEGLSETIVDDDFDLESNELLESFEDTTEDLIEENVSETQEEEKEEVLDTDTLDSLDNIDNIDDIDNIDNIDDIIDNIDDIDTNIEAMETSLEQVDEIIENQVETQEIQETKAEAEETEEENTESFGSNLLDNLEADDISIENLGLDEVEEEENKENISSTELFSDIDDLLNSSDEQETNTETESDTEAMSDIPNISELTDEIEDIESEIQSEEISEFEMDNLLDDSEDISEESEKSEENEENEEIGMLYSEDAESETRLPGEHFMRPKSSGGSKKAILVAAALIAILAAGAFTVIKNNSGNNDEIAEYTPASEEPVEENLLSVNTPNIQNKETKVEAKEQNVKELKNNLPAVKNNPQTYMAVSRLVWDVPDSISYSKNMQNYLRTAGRSIKLSLSADILLATEFAYTNQVKVNIKLSNSGALQDVSIVSSSGSTEIDKIVLQSVKDTLNVLKPPANELKDQNVNLNLIIYF